MKSNQGTNLGYFGLKPGQYGKQVQTLRGAGAPPEEVKVAQPTVVGDEQDLAWLAEHQKGWKQWEELQKQQVQGVSVDQKELKASEGMKKPEGDPRGVKGRESYSRLVSRFL